jgi:hypothetical protein
MCAFADGQTRRGKNWTDGGRGVSIFLFFLLPVCCALPFGVVPVFGVGGCGRVLLFLSAAQVCRVDDVFGVSDWRGVPVDAKGGGTYFQCFFSCLPHSHSRSHSILPFFFCIIIVDMHHTDPRNAGNNTACCDAALLRCRGAQGQSLGIHV